MYNEAAALEACPALVLNADNRPLSYYPLSLWSWQDAIKAVFLESVNIVSEYDRIVRGEYIRRGTPEADRPIQEHAREARDYYKEQAREAGQHVAAAAKEAAQRVKEAFNNARSKSGA